MAATIPVDLKNELHKDGSGIVLAYKGLEEHGSTWPGIRMD